MRPPRARVGPAARGPGPGRSPRRAPRARRRASLLLVLCALVVATLAGVPAPSATATPPSPVAPAAPGDDPVVLRVDGLNPRVVTADGPAELLVTGSVANRGSTTVGDLGVRVQRGVAVRTERDARTALSGTEADEQVRPEFTPVASVLDPGEQVPFTLRVPLRGPAGTSLGLTEPGVYPLLVNANGREGNAGATRLGAVRMLLGVVDLPGPRTSAPRDEPVAAGVLYPIADRPRRLPVVPGTTPQLTDDELADSMAPGGRLAGLVDALRRAAPLGSPAAGSVCLAVDADLLDTARVMADGYEVRTPDGVVPGRGAGAARQWLTDVRAQATGRCVVALPYADTDVVATSRGNLADLTTTARTAGQRRVAELLGTPPLDATTAPADGFVDERTTADLVTGGARTLLLAGDVLDEPAPEGGVARLDGPPGSSAAVVALDPLAATALAPRRATSDGVVSPAGTAAPLGAQDALGVLVLRARQVAAGDSGATPVTIAAPPHAWAVGGDEAAAYLEGVGDLARRGLVRPLDIGAPVAAGTSGAPMPTTSLADRDGAASGDAAEAGPDEAVVARAREVRDRQRDLLAASQRDRIGAPAPADLVDPLTEGLLRALSAARRGDPAAQDAAVSEVEGQMDAMLSRVRVVQPAGPYALGSNDAPLLLTVENRLPVAMNVQVVVAPTPGLRTRDLPVVTVPADGSRQLSVDVEVVRSGQFAVDARAETPGGEALGPPARLLLRSTAYGTITVWLTASAGVMLVVLASIRITRRVLAARRARRSRTRRRAGRGSGRTPGPGTTTDDPSEPPTRELQTR